MTINNVDRRTLRVLLSTDTDSKRTNCYCFFTTRLIHLMHLNFKFKMTIRNVDRRTPAVLLSTDDVSLENNECFCFCFCFCFYVHTFCSRYLSEYVNGGTLVDLLLARLNQFFLLLLPCREYQALVDRVTAVTSLIKNPAKVTKSKLFCLRTGFLHVIRNAIADPLTRKRSCLQANLFITPMTTKRFYVDRSKHVGAPITKCSISPACLISKQSKHHNLRYTGVRINGINLSSLYSFPFSPTFYSDTLDQNNSSTRPMKQAEERGKENKQGHKETTRKKTTKQDKKAGIQVGTLCNNTGNTGPRRFPLFKCRDDSPTIKWIPLTGRNPWKELEFDPRLNVIARRNGRNSQFEDTKTNKEVVVNKGNIAGLTGPCMSVLFL